MIDYIHKRAMSVDSIYLTVFANLHHELVTDCIKVILPSLSGVLFILKKKSYITLVFASFEENVANIRYSSISLKLRYFMYYSGI